MRPYYHSSVAVAAGADCIQIAHRLVHTFAVVAVVAADARSSAAAVRWPSVLAAAGFGSIVLEFGLFGPRSVPSGFPPFCAGPTAGIAGAAAHFVRIA